MATSSMVPYSNPAGKNQTSPSSTPAPILTLPSASPLNPTAAASSNPYIPPSAVIPTSSTAPTSGTTSPSGATPNTVAPDGFITPNSSYSSGENDLQKQLIDIYGKGTGGSLYTLLSNMSGTNSTVLQEYINSLAPQEAKAQANLDASLGAAGVSANSSVAAIGDANLQAQEFGLISGESANLTKSQEDLTAQLLAGMSSDSAKEVATSGWTVFGNVMNQITGDVGQLLGGRGPSGGAPTSSMDYGGVFSGGAGSVPTAQIDTSLAEPDYAATMF